MDSRAEQHIEEILRARPFCKPDSAFSRYQRLRDLKRCLEETIEERIATERKALDLRKQEHILEDLIAKDEVPNAVQLVGLSVQRGPVAHFIQETVGGDGTSWTIDALKRAAKERGLSFGEKNPGRVLHFALVGMSRNGLVEMTAKGTWRWKTAPAISSENGPGAKEGGAR